MERMNSPALRDLLQAVRFPKMALVRQELNRDRIGDVREALRGEAVRQGLADRIRPGQSVAVAVGSRGIHGLEQVVGELCALLLSLGARPFIVPAMGSHGGAAARGQVDVLARLGLTETTLGVPVRSGMEVVEIGRTAWGSPVLIDALAACADHLVAVNRIKAHTKFKAPVESGLMKMLAVGLGNDQGARLVHALAPIHGMYAVIAAMAGVVLVQGNLLCGVGLVENGLGRLHTLQMLLPGEIPKQEPGLLTLAKKLAPGLPFEALDVLVVDEIGKDISGTGMDTNVTGRNRDILGDFTTTPRIKRIFVRDLSSATAGNALGLGFADVTTDRAIRSMAYEKTLINALTGLSPEKAAIPVHLPTDRLALAATIHTLGAVPPGNLRMARIKNTGNLERLLVSPALLEDPRASLEILCPPRAMDFIGDDLAPFPES